ncbi:DUF1365 family protein [Rhizobiaceae bacterium n13]|uniref:DUF1365 family protein n=1 Tax=Ferirhizobium litorale TaxID=2927786 RepID=A0AAE3U3K4_9HYPH|nr:DUF1365 family protein [Fererhizobium litorale]MDI7862625.1 DUF1365 family protein [Fererhizobium litorale]MDI7923892.1 DUF1365 family protein [Fererhizobium litorale]
MTTHSALYAGKVVHARHRPRRHMLSYRVFSLLLDLDELEECSRRMRLFGHNSPALFSFWDKDHGDGTEGGLNSWVKRQLDVAGVAVDGIRISVLCYPRILGYVFNPLSVYFCKAEDGTLRAILYEVCNTFHERHTYVIPVADAGAGTIRQSCAKQLYVSPFVPMQCNYRFRIIAPGTRVLVGIDEADADGLLLVATFTGERRQLCDRQLIRTFFQYPLMTLKVMAGIHWEALRLWTKGVPVHRHRPAQNPVATTIVQPDAMSKMRLREPA